MITKGYASALAMVVATMLTHQVAAPPIAQYDRAPAPGNVGLRPYDQSSAMAIGATFLGGGSDPTYLGDQQQLLRGPGYRVLSG
jgi:hypothetical protein